MTAAASTSARGPGSRGPKTRTAATKPAMRMTTTNVLIASRPTVAGRAPKGANNHAVSGGYAHTHSSASGSAQFRATLAAIGPYAPAACHASWSYGEAPVATRCPAYQNWNVSPDPSIGRATGHSAMKRSSAGKNGRSGRARSARGITCPGGVPEAARAGPCATSRSPGGSWSSCASARDRSSKQALRGRDSQG